MLFRSEEAGAKEAGAKFAGAELAGAGAMPGEGEPAGPGLADGVGVVWATTPSAPKPAPRSTANTNAANRVLRVQWRRERGRNVAAQRAWPKAKLHTYAQAGHMVHEDAAEASVNDALSFVKSLK